MQFVSSSFSFEFLNPTNSSDNFTLSILSGAPAWDISISPETAVDSNEKGIATIEFIAPNTAEPGTSFEMVVGFGNDEILDQVTVILEVNSLQGIRIWSIDDKFSEFASPGETVFFDVRVVNYESQEQDVDLSYNSEDLSGWSVVFNNQSSWSKTLPAGSSTSVSVGVTPPSSESVDTVDLVKLNSTLKSLSNVIDFITIATTGNATDFGDLTSILRNIATCASSTRGIFASGQSPSNNDVIMYTTISSSGGCNDFGNLSSVMTNSNEGCTSDNTRGLIVFGSNVPAVRQGSIEFVTIPTTGDSTGFGELSVARRHTASMASPIRGVFASGKNDYDSVYLKNIDFVIIQTQGTAVSFGEISGNGREQSVGAGNKTRGLIAGGLGSGPTPFQNIDFSQRS